MGSHHPTFIFFLSLTQPISPILPHQLHPTTHKPHCLATMSSTNNNQCSHNPSAYSIHPSCSHLGPPSTYMTNPIHKAWFSASINIIPQLHTDQSPCLNPLSNLTLIQAIYISFCFTNNHSGNIDDTLHHWI